MGKKVRRGRGQTESSQTRFYDSGEDKQSASSVRSYESCTTNGNDDSLKSSFQHHLAHEEVAESVNQCFNSSGPLEVTILEVDQTLTENNIQSQLDDQDSTTSFKPQFVAISPTKLSKPPPLPPKPKLLATGIKAGHVMSKPLHKIVQSNSATIIESCENKNVF